MHNDRELPENVTEFVLCGSYEDDNDVEMYAWVHFDEAMQHCVAVSSSIALSKFNVKQIKVSRGKLYKFVVDYLTELTHK